VFFLQLLSGSPTPFDLVLSTMENSPNLSPENFFSSLVIDIIYGNSTKNQFILVSQKLFFMANKTSTQRWLCLQIHQRHVMSMAKPMVMYTATPTITPTTTPHGPTPTATPKATPLAMIWLRLYYTHGYATWLCPKAMLINNFYGGLYAKKITLSTASISFHTFIRLSLRNIFVWKTWVTLMTRKKNYMVILILGSSPIGLHCILYNLHIFINIL